jgi:hypothetical protein
LTLDSHPVCRAAVRATTVGVRGFGAKDTIGQDRDICHDSERIVAVEDHQQPIDQRTGNSKGLRRERAGRKPRVKLILHKISKLVHLHFTHGTIAHAEALGQETESGRGAILRFRNTKYAPCFCRVYRQVKDMSTSSVTVRCRRSGARPA